MWFIGVELEQETSAPPPKKKSWIRPCELWAGNDNTKGETKYIKRRLKKTTATTGKDGVTFFRKDRNHIDIRELWILRRERLRVDECEIFSIVGSAHAWTSVILAGKRGSRRHFTTSLSENVVVAKTRYQIIKLEVLAFCKQKRT